MCLKNSCNFAVIVLAVIETLNKSSLSLRNKGKQGHRHCPLTCGELCVPLVCWCLCVRVYSLTRSTAKTEARWGWHRPWKFWEEWVVEHASPFNAARDPFLVECNFKSRQPRMLTGGKWFSYYSANEGCSTRRCRWLDGLWLCWWHWQLSTTNDSHNYTSNNRQQTRDRRH